MFQSICVFCGSRPGTDPAYVEAARALGRLLAQQRITLIFGGGATGMMGALADAVLAAGGRAVGVIPESMNVPNVVHEGLNELIITPTMYSRKVRMFKLADAFITLPGGLGTLDELFEALTLSQLGYELKPIGLLNVAGYYDPLMELIEHAVQAGFIAPRYRDVFTVAATPSELLEALAAFQHPLAKTDTARSIP